MKLYIYNKDQLVHEDAVDKHGHTAVPVILAAILAICLLWLVIISLPFFANLSSTVMVILLFAMLIGVFPLMQAVNNRIYQVRVDLKDIKIVRYRIEGKRVLKSPLYMHVWLTSQVDFYIHPELFPKFKATLENKGVQFAVLR
jgi:hypothetical protein